MGGRGAVALDRSVLLLTTFSFWHSGGALADRGLFVGRSKYLPPSVRHDGRDDLRILVWCGRWCCCWIRAREIEILVGGTESIYPSIECSPAFGARPDFG